MIFCKHRIEDLNIKFHCKYCLNNTVHSRKKYYTLFVSMLDLISFGLYSLFSEKDKNKKHIYCSECGYCHGLPFLQRVMSIYAVRDFFKFFLLIVGGLFFVRLFMMIYIYFQ